MEQNERGHNDAAAQAGRPCRQATNKIANNAQEQ